MKRVVQVLLVLMVVLAAAYYFTVDVLLKSAIEREGSKALQAELNIASVNFRLFPLGITLRDVQATNPHQPMRNLLVAHTISSTFTIGQVLDHKIVADDVQLRGLRFNQPRLRSGAIAGLTPEPKPVQSSGSLPGLSLPDTDKLIAAEKLRVQTELRQLRDSLTQTRDGWRQRLQSLPDQNRINDYRQRAQSLQQMNALQRVAGVEQLRREVKADLDNLNTLREQARADWQNAQAQLDSAKNLPQRELDRVLASAGLDHGTEFLNEKGMRLTQALLGGEFAPLIEQLQGLANLPQTGGASEPSATPQWQVLARAIALDGQLDIGKQALRFEGVVHNVTPQPRVWNVATDFALQAAADQPGKFELSGTLDQRKGVAANVRFALQGFPVQQLPLSSSEQFNVSLQQAQLDVEGLLRMEDFQIDFGLFGLFKQAQLAIDAGANPIAQTLAGALRTINQFDLNLAMTGDLRAPKVELKSSLDQILAAAIGDQVRAQTAQLAEKMQGQLQREVAPELAAINQLGVDFQSMQQNLLERQDALQSLLDLRNSL